jgi:hypothetical protein
LTRTPGFRTVIDVMSLLGRAFVFTGFTSLVRLEARSG